MRVRCVYDSVHQLPESGQRTRLAQYTTESAFEGLSVGEEYDVLAIQRWRDGGLRVYVRDRGADVLPRPYGIELFEIVDATVPDGWRVTLATESDRVDLLVLSFPAWSADPLFYERLVEGDKQALARLEEAEATIGLRAR
jgi:hypothetical protein